MSYDLYFAPRAGSSGAEQFAEYLSTRAHYKVEAGQAWYQNEETGVYFVLERHEERAANEQDGPYHPLSLTINYFRPSYFILEAEPEITAFVRALDLRVSDPQVGGMGEGEYDRERLISAWHKGNESGYAAILSKPENYEDVFSLPTSVLMSAWRWNLNRPTLQAELGPDRFVSQVMFITHSGKPATAAVWPDGIPMAVPQVDYLFVPRKELAPRRFLRRVEDRTLVAWNDALPLFNRIRSPRFSDFVLLDYDTPDKEVRTFVESLPADKSEIQGVPSDQMLDRELVEKYQRAG